MPRTIEHSTAFHMARRIAKLVAPDFRVFATEQLQPRDVVVDLKRKTIEVGERTQGFEAVGAILFACGQLKQRDDSKFKEHFGDFSKVTILDQKLMKKLASQGAEADRNAAKWAIDVFVSNWNVSQERAEMIVKSYCWDVSDWIEYYEA